MGDLELNELKIKEDLRHSLEIYSEVDDFETQGEIDEGVACINELSRAYRHMHVELKATLGVEEYTKKYTNYDVTLKKATDFLKKARIQLKSVKRESDKNVEPDLVLHEKFQNLFVDQEILDMKIKQVNHSIDFREACDASELNEYIRKMESFLNEYFDMSGRHKCSLRDEYNGERFECEIKNISDDIKVAKMLRKKMCEISASKEIEISKESLKCDQVLRGENLYEEITQRLDILDFKYDQDLDILGDYQILEISQNKNLDLEFNTILEKVTDLSALVSGGGGDVRKMLETAINRRDSVSVKRKNFLKKLQSIIVQRDVTPEKMKNATTFRIELPKFGGYESKMDFYTFKTEFIKLVEPVVQKQYLCDFLKRNYLCGSALTLVEKETEYLKIWDKLKDSFGNERLLLQNKLSHLDNIGGLWKIKGDEKVANALAGLLNAMSDLSSLAAAHSIEGQLYEGGGLEKVMSLLGDYRHRKFRSQNLDSVTDKKSEWKKLSAFLQTELKLREKMVLDNKSAQLMGIDLKKETKKRDSDEKDCKKLPGPVHSVFPYDMKCHVCDGGSHTIITTFKGNKIIPYYVCELFIRLSPAERYTKLKEKNLCTSCIFPGAIKGPKHKCLYLNFCCPHKHDKQEKIHVLLCEQHKKEDKNLKLLEKFKDKFIRNCNQVLPKFTQNISCFSESVNISRSTEESLFKELDSKPDVQDSAIFLLQTIEVAGVRLNLFFDNGCGDLVIKKSAAEKLRGIGRACQTVQGPLQITGVGDHQSDADGVFCICLPLHDGSNVTLSGVCLPKITSKFPIYDLREVESDCKAWSRGAVDDPLPKLPVNVGGETDILIGSKYLRYFPKVVFEHETGLGIYRSQFKGSDGSRGVLNGPHPKFSEIERKFRGNHVKPETYFVQEVQMIRAGATYSVPLLGMKVDPILHISDFPSCCTNVDSIDELTLSPENKCTDEGIDVALVRRPPKCVKQFDMVEESGTEVTYRCVDCRGCLKCKNGPRIDSVSIQEEIEETLINRSVTVDLEKGISSAKLPFVTDPDSRIAVDEQRNLALKVFHGQIRALNAKGKEKDKAAVIESEQKLHDLGFVDWVDNLSEDERTLILNNVQYLIPWRAVYNENSVSTPTRLVFDASQSTKNGTSLNSLLAKGINSLNKLVEIMIRWTTHPHAYHTDVSKMYNRVVLETEHWRYQLYFWTEGLDSGVAPRLKVIKTVIYGVRPSGNLAQCALRRTAELCATRFPRALNPILEDTYMDDCISGTEGPEVTRLTIDEIDCTVPHGGFSTKGFVVSGEDPPEVLSDGKDFVLVGGIKWFPKGDFISMNIGELNFSKRIRGKKSKDNVGIVPELLTKRNCVSRSAELFDILGLLSPIVGGIKLDISELHVQCPMWDDSIPTQLKEIWVKNFDLLNEIRHLKFHRAVVPSDAVNLDIDTIETADAGKNLICAAVYARFKLRNGTYSCQLIFSRTKIVHDLSTPRAELEAAVLNASTGHIVRLSLKDKLKRSLKLSDSQVALHWINCTRYALKMWVRNRVIEITRLTDLSTWRYVCSKDNISDLGTRKGAQISDISPDSYWIRGYPWMREIYEKFPLKTIDELVLSANEKNDSDKEKVVADYPEQCSQCLISRSVPSEVGDRYSFSRYLIDPNKFRFKTVIRILALVFIFLKKLNDKWNQKCRKNRSLAFLRKRDFSICASNNVIAHYFVTRVNFTLSRTRVFVAYLSESMLNSAKAYFFEKASTEVIHFLDANKYKNFSKLNDGILYHTGRILLVQEIDGRSHLADACLDLAASTFCVPITDAHSPVAYAIVAETHWHNPDVSHGGVESVLRYSQQTAYIIGGRPLVKSMKRSCPRCRFLHKKGVRVAMGPVSDDSLRIAPPFFVSQVDICGHFSAYSPANKRATLKVWFVVFCCTVTGATDCRIMEDYSADGFLMAFSRFACRFGYPKKLLPDEGGQLMKGCRDMVISMSDIRQKLSVEFGVEFETCPVGAHNAHGKVERKIQDVKKSLTKNIHNKRLSILQWETLGQQISNSINNLPIGLANKTEMLESIDILTPNRLILGRNNNRSPTAPLEITHDIRKIVHSNNEIFKAWFKEWLVSYVPQLIQKPKWFISDRSIAVGDVVLILKSDKEFDLQYQFGIVSKTIESKDGLIRSVEVEYQNLGENTKRKTKRGVRELIVIHPVEEIGISKELYDIANSDF